MDRLDANIETIHKLLDPDDNRTGGGTASALAGAMAGALVAMVTRLSIGKPGMEPESFYRAIDSAAQTLSNELLDGARHDSEAFEAVRRAYKMARETAEEKARRRETIQSAWIEAARVPLLNAERCAEVLELARQLQGRTNPDAESDLRCAFYLSRAGVLGCVANVEINVPSITDTKVTAELIKQADTLRKQATETRGSER